MNIFECLTKYKKSFIAKSQDCDMQTSTLFVFKYALRAKSQRRRFKETTRIQKSSVAKIQTSLDV